MSTAGLITMLTAWTIIGFITIRFFIKVLNTPQKMD
mgnify:CR=1 FL=1